MSIFEPEFDLQLKEVSSLLLPVAGTLLGLVYAGLIYWFQGALEGLKFTGDLLEELVAAHGKLLLDLLVGASLVSLFGYFSLDSLASAMFWLFTVMISVDILRYVAVRGDLITMFSKKFIPAHYGRVRQFLRQLRNAGFVGWFMPVVLIVLTVVYPLGVSWFNSVHWKLTEQALVTYLLVCTGVGLFQVRSLLVEAVHARKTISNSNEQ